MRRGAGCGKLGGQVGGYSGLREFLALLEREGELARIGVPVALDQELGAVCVHSLRNGGPALLFQRPGGYDVPIVVNVLATRRRYGLALGCAPDETQHEWNRRTARPLPPVLVESGPCQEVMRLGDEADLTCFPAPTWNALDGGPYLTLSCPCVRESMSVGGALVGEANGLVRVQTGPRNVMPLVEFIVYCDMRNTE